MISTGEQRRASELGRDYGYSNARIRGMKSRLLGKDFFERLIAAHDMSGVLTVLHETEYGPDLEGRIIHGRNATQIDLALKDNMVRTFRKVLDLLNDEAYELVTTLLGRWDLFNLKTIVRGKHMHLSRDEILESMLPAGQLGHFELEELAAAEDVRAVVDIVGTWGIGYAAALRGGYSLYAKSGELPDLELALDRYYSQWAAARLRRRGANAEIARRILSVQIDTVNLLTAFRLLKADLEGLDPARFFLPGGSGVSEDLFHELTAMSDIDEVLDRLKPTVYGRAMDEVAMQFLESGSMSVFERALEDLLTRRALALGIGDPLGVGVVVSYLWAKQNEVTNVRIIVRGQAVGMPVSRMREELILV